MGADQIFAGSGKAYVADYGTATLPTSVADFEASLDAAFIDLGEVHEDGLEHAFSVDRTVVRNWAGLAVKTIGTATEITFKLKFLEANGDVIGLYYGTPVTTNAGESKLAFGVPADAARALVIPVIDYATGRTKLYVLPRVEVGEREDLTDKPDEPAAYGVTFQALYDEVTGGSGYILFSEDLTALSA